MVAGSRESACERLRTNRNEVGGLRVEAKPGCVTFVGVNGVLEGVQWPALSDTPLSLVQERYTPSEAHLEAQPSDCHAAQCLSAQPAWVRGEAPGLEEASPASPKPYHRAAG